MKRISILLLFVLYSICCLAQIYDKPVFDRTDTPELHIDKVEITTDTTFIYCTYYAEEGSWANISKDTYLEDTITKKKYPLLKIEGLPLFPEKRIFSYSGSYTLLYCFPHMT